MRPVSYERLLKLAHQRAIDGKGGLAASIAKMCLDSRADLSAEELRLTFEILRRLIDQVKEGAFREDLFYRLNVFPVHLPPLRDRAGDVRILARHFLLNANREYQRNTVFAVGVMERLESYNWPGNIRQLENVIKRAVLISLDGNITRGDIEVILNQESAITDHLEAGQTASYPGASTPLLPGNTLASNERDGMAGAMNGRPYSWVSEDESEALTDALMRTNGNKTRAAALLGMTARQFRYRLQKLGIDG